MTPTPRQAAIVGWLRRVNAHAGDMYESALWLTAHERIPCRGRMIAHAYREICSVLLNEYSSNSREDLDGKLKDFVGEYRKLNINFEVPDRKSTRLNSSHSQISYAVFCLKKKKYLSASATGRYFLTRVKPARQFSLWGRARFALTS